MAEDIVACPGCGKKFRIPEGAPGGTFACTACNADVPYGKAAQKAGARAAAPSKAAAPSRGPAKAAPAAPARGAASAKAAPASRGSRRAHEEEDEEPEDRRHRGAKKDKDSQTILWVSVAGIVVVAIGAVLFMKNQPKPAAKPDVAPPPAPQAPVAPTPAAPANPTPAAGGGDAAAPAASGGGGGGSAAAPSGIGEAKPAAGGGGSVAPSNLDALFVRIDDIAGVTPQDRAAYDKDVAALIDRDTGAAGVAAGRRLLKANRKAIPALLSVFESHWKGKRWEDDREKIAAHEVQMILKDIVMADRPGGDFIARFDPRSPVPAKDFEKAARMWVRWWLERGKDIETFKKHAD